MARKLATFALLTFVVFSAGYAVGKEVGMRRAMPAPRAADGLHVWYFHSSKRCKTCNTIEAFAKEAIDTRFADGQVQWHTANMDDARYADPVKRYGLIRSSLVIVVVEDGAETEFQVLDRTWDLVDKKDWFLDYVEGEIEMFFDEEES